MKQRVLMMLTLTVLLISGCEFDNPAEDDQSGSDTASKNPVGWYMRTTATATLPDGRRFEHRTAGVFGELQESTDEKDRHDIVSYGEAVLQVLFIHPEWDNDAGTYFSDYRAYGSSEKRVWTFQVKNQSEDINLSDADLTLGIEGVYDIYEGTKSRFEEKHSKDNSKKTSLTLVDVDHQTTYSYEALKTAHLAMDGKYTRTFRWVLGEVDAEDMEPLSLEGSTENTAVKSTKSTLGTKKRNSRSKFGLPPR